MDRTYTRHADQRAIERCGRSLTIHDRQRMVAAIHAREAVLFRLRLNKFSQVLREYWVQLDDDWLRVVYDPRKQWIVTILGRLEDWRPHERVSE